MSTRTASQRLRVSVSALVRTLSVAGLVALAPAAAHANPVAKPKIDTRKSVPGHKAGMHTYVLQLGKTKKVVKAKRIKVVRPSESAKLTAVFVDGNKQMVSGVVSVAIATFGGSGTGTGTCTAQAQTTTTTQLRGGGTRTDIDHGGGAKTTTIHDPNGGTNGGWRTITSATNGGGKTTTTITTTDGAGATTTTISTSP